MCRTASDDSSSPSGILASAIRFFASRTVGTGYMSGTLRSIGAPAVTGQVTAAVFSPASRAFENSVGTLMSS
jgi:hypothetical protein